MPHYLIIDDAWTGDTWRIPDGADPEGVLHDLKVAMEDGAVIGVQLQTDEEMDVELVFNGKAVGTVALMDL